MSVFIALIAESYEKARADLAKETANLLSRTPATGDEKVLHFSQKEAGSMLHHMRVRNMISRELSISLRQPLGASLAESKYKHKEEESANSVRCCCRKKNTVVQKALQSGSSTKLKRAQTATSLLSAWGDLGTTDDSNDSESTESDAEAVVHPVDTFTDDDDNLSFDETRDLFGNNTLDSKYAQTVYTYGACTVKVFAVRNVKNERGDVYVAVKIGSRQQRTPYAHVSRISETNHAAKWTSKEIVERHNKTCDPERHATITDGFALNFLDLSRIPPQCRIRLMDPDIASRDVVGEAVLPLGHQIEQDSQRKWLQLKLDGKIVGEVEVHVEWARATASIVAEADRRRSPGEGDVLAAKEAETRAEERVGTDHLLPHTPQVEEEVGVNRLPPHPPQAGMAQRLPWQDELFADCEHTDGEMTETMGLPVPRPLAPPPVTSPSPPRSPVEQLGGRNSEVLEQRVGQLEQSVARGFSQFNSKHAEMKYQMDDIKTMLRAIDRQI
jgi:hypothetical protein